jgi:virulence-associated protein VagC
MAFKFSQNVKVGIQCSDGELIMEFKRPTKEDLNKFTAAKLDMKADNIEKRLNAIDGLRISFYDQAIEAIYISNRDGAREEVVGEDDKPIDPKKVPDDVKIKAVLNAFEMNSVYVKNF